METYDIKELKELLDDVDTLLSSQSKSERPTISYKVEPGSVKNIFRTTRQMAVQFGALLTMVSSQNSLSGLDIKTAKAFEHLQMMSDKKGYRINISSTGMKGSVLVINPNTAYYIPQEVWVDTEVYLYGVLVDAGGKSASNIHLTTDNGKNYTISTTREQLQNEERNMLYKYFGVRAKGKQKIDTGEIKDDSLELIELLAYKPLYNEDYLDSLIKKATPKWNGVTDADQWVRNIRGYE